MRGYTDIFTENVFQTKDYTYHNLKNLIRAKDVVIMKGDKDSSVVILNKTDYIEKLENMVKEGTESSMIVEVIRTNFRLLFFFDEKILQA